MSNVSRLLQAANMLLASLLEDVHEFVVHWDYGDYSNEPGKLAALAKEFPYNGPAFRASANPKTKPPLSWSKSLEELIGFWKHAGMDKPKIPVYQANVRGIDVVALCEWYIKNATSQEEKFRAERLMSFAEVLTLEIPVLTQIGTLVDKTRGPHSNVVFVKQ